MMAVGIQELKKDLGRKQGLNELPEIHQFLDRCYMSRIGIRMLIGQHVALHDPNPPPGYVGLICTKVSPVIVPQMPLMMQDLHVCEHMVLLQTFMFMAIQISHLHMCQLICITWYLNW